MNGRSILSETSWLFESMANGPGWTFLSNRAHVLLCIAKRPSHSERWHIGWGWPRRAVQRIVADLEEGVLLALAGRPRLPRAGSGAAGAAGRATAPDTALASCAIGSRGWVFSHAARIASTSRSNWSSCRARILAHRPQPVRFHAHDVDHPIWRPTTAVRLGRMARMVPILAISRCVTNFAWLDGRGEKPRGNGVSVQAPP